MARNRRTIRLELTAAEADALLRLAECAGDVYDDALGVLDHDASVRAGYRAIEKLSALVRR